MVAAPNSSGSPKPPKPNDMAIQNNVASGMALRESLFNGTLSAEAQHALMYMDLLRQGLIGRPVPHEVRKAVVTARMNSGLRGVLLSEISLASSSAPMQNPGPGRTTPAFGGSAFPEQSADVRSERPRSSHTGSSKPSATPSRAAGPGPGNNVAHAETGNLKRKRSGGPWTDNSKGPYKPTEARASATSATGTPTKRSSFSIASKLMLNLFSLSSKAASDPDPLQDGSEGTVEGDNSSADDLPEYASAGGIHSHRDTGAESTPLEVQGQHASEDKVTTASGRPYTEWHFANGKKLDTCGALLPDRYVPQLDPNRPWVCPVMGCQEVCSDILGLGSHFKRDHDSACMNDNGDGTLSVVKYRKGTGSCPAIVVSRTPQPRRPSTTTATTTPYLPGSSVEDSATSSLPDGVHSYASQRLQAAAAPATSTWDIIHPHLGPVPYSPIPQKGHVQGLLPLLRKREVEFNSQSNRFFVSRPQDISAMIIQITGTEAPTACTRCRQGKGPFVGCVEVSASAPEEVKHWVKSCANCFYKGNQKYCDLPKLQPAVQSVAPASSPQPTSIAAPDTNLTEGSARRADEASSHGSDDVPIRDIQTGSHDTPVYEMDQLRHSSDASSRGRHRPSHETPAHETRQLRHRALASPDPIQGRGHSTRPNVPVTIEEVGTAETMCLEEWEIAPGRIRDAASARIENIAFSSAYLTHSEEVAVNRDLGFNVLFVKGGSMHRWEAIANKFRICSVAIGKVKVTMPDREFEISRNGMFKVKSGTSCTVENPHYGEATIHISTMSDDYDF